MLRHPRMTKRILNSLLAAWFVLHASGFPVPVVIQSDNRTIQSKERFPCENCQCGCPNADYCWTKCCCHTLEERIAWAKRNDVRPPEEVLQKAAREGIDVTRWGIEQPLNLCLAGADCVVDNLPPCCRARVANAKKSCSCCDSESCCNSKPAHVKIASCCKNTTKASAKNTQGLSIWQSMACQGLAKQWLTGSVGPMPKFTDWSPSESWFVTTDLTDEDYPNRSELPQPPPPQYSA